ncbi:MAG: phosphoribosylformylglycinamidine synthase subunit PurL [Bacteroidia bacterium]|nr:phosphoribosylformylglycinamidine synthase subunit PurL [Bacteroidia bacterium]MDW8089497.1 phosphoribosylformylglycinamidine synthase subunit PurL [Bacteroidia bacterium]
MGPVSASRTIAQRAGLSEAEYERILNLLGREPTEVEVWIFSALWSEHCSYKSSLLHLRRLPRRGRCTLRMAGEENAGLLDIGEGWAVAFKVESHNHPSAVAPYQGAATGVGGIHRDILAVGARPIAALDSLHFGYPIDASTRALLEGVVRGIADYGNALGVPTIGGETYFAPAYKGKPIVNVLSVGLVPKDRIVSARAQGIGNRVLYLGAPTGPDGVGGAAFASEVLEHADKPSLAVIQVGNPFREKLLLEAIGEMVAEGLIVGMQDMGAAGLASSTAETAARGGVGMRIWLDKVPLRGGVHTPQEILLSESQERMLLIATPEAIPALQRIAQKWELLLVDIGEVTDTQEVEYWWRGHKVAALPPKLLLAGEGAPLYDWPKEPPTYLREIAAFSSTEVPDIRSVAELEGALERLLVHPDLGSKAWIYRQYDRMVGGCTIGSAGELPAAAPLIRLPYTNRALAVSLDGNPWWVEASPRIGTALAVAEAARQVACTGAVPLGVTNCLNFGSPQNPSVYWQFVEAVEGLREACEALDLPVTGGNVSFYNEDAEGAILPTPVIGIVGLLEEALQRWVPMALPKCAARLYLVGSPASLAEPSLGASHYLREVRGIRYAPPPRLDLAAERRLIQLLPTLAAQGLLLAAQDVSDGGLLLSLLEMALAGTSGFVAIQPEGVRTDAFWFGEDGGRVIVAVAPNQAQKLERQVAEAGLSAVALGEVVPGGGYGILHTPYGIARLDLLRLRAKYASCLETHLVLAT